MAVGGVGGGLLGAAGSYMQGQSQASQLNFNARQTRIDGQIALQNAEEGAKALRIAGRQLTGTQRVRYAKSGLRLEGTPLEVMASSIENIQLDAIKQRQQGIFAQQQANIQAKFLKQQAGQAKTAGTIGAIGGLLGGGAGAAGMFV
jgi:hypothetical protein